MRIQNRIEFAIKKKSKKKIVENFSKSNFFAKKIKISKFQVFITENEIK